MTAKKTKNAHNSKREQDTYIDGFIPSLEPDLIANVVYVFECRWHILGQCTKLHCLRPHTLVWLLELEARLDALEDSLAYAHFSQLLLFELLGHLLEPEIHGVVYDLDGATFDYACGDGRVAEVLTGVYDALIIEASSAGVHKACLDEGLAHLACGLEFRLLS